MITTIVQLINDLEKIHGNVARKIDVEIDPETGKKVCRGEKNNFTQAEIAADRGLGNTWSIALKYCKGLVCVDFDQKDLENSKLFALLVERDCLRVETTKGWHVYVKTDGTGTKEIGVGGDFKVDLLTGKRNVWETADRVLTGQLIDVPWVYLEEHLDFTAKKKRAREAVVESEAGVPTEIERWLTDKFTAGKITVKQETRQKKQRQGNKTVITEQVITCTSICVGCKACPAGGKHSNHQYVDACRDEKGKLFSVSLRCTSPTCEFDSEDRTAEALNYDQCLVWNLKVAFVEKSASFVYTAANQDPVPITSREQIDMIMCQYSNLDARTWLQHPDCSRFHKQSFYPSLTPPEETYGPCKDLNLFTGFAMQPDAAADPELAQPLLKHIKLIWCKGNETHYRYVMGMFASMLQRPQQRNAVVLCLVSKQGSGKGIVLSKLGQSMGPQTFKQVSDPKTVFGDFNETLSCGVCIVLDEMLYAGNMAASNQFKSLITEESIRINPKYGRPWTETMYQNYVITSNSSWIVQASADQRRFFCLEPSDKYSGVNTPETRDYFQTLLDVPVNSFAHVLYNWDLSKFNPRQIPASSALVSQQKESLSAVESALYECLQRGVLGPTNGFEQELSFGQTISRSELFQRWTNEFGATYGWPTKAVKFWSEMKRILGTNLHMDAGRRQINGQRSRCLELSDLNVIRAHWEQTYFRDDWCS